MPEKKLVVKEPELNVYYHFYFIDRETRKKKTSIFEFLGYDADNKLIMRNVIRNGLDKMSLSHFLHICKENLYDKVYVSRAKKGRKKAEKSQDVLTESTKNTKKDKTLGPEIESAFKYKQGEMIETLNNVSDLQAERIFRIIGKSTLELIANVNKFFNAKDPDIEERIKLFDDYDTVLKIIKA